MKYIKKLNIDFNNWDNIPMSTNEKQIKELHPIFYQFLKEKNLMNFYLKMFDKCHLEDRGNTFKEIMNSYHNKQYFRNDVISCTLSYYKCVKLNKFNNIINSLDNDFYLYYKKNKI